MSGSENIVGAENVLLESMDSSRYVWAITPVYGASRTKWLNYVLNKVECENCWKCPPGSKEKFLLRQKGQIKAIVLTLSSISFTEGTDKPFIRITSF